MSCERATSRGDAARMRVATVDEPDAWRVVVREELRADREALTVIAGHEMAHVALRVRGLHGRSPAETERLTDTAAVLAWYGPLMSCVSFRERVRVSPGGRWRAWSAELGHLHQRAVEYVRTRRAALATGVDAPASRVSPPDERRRGATITDS